MVYYIMKKSAQEQKGEPMRRADADNKTILESNSLTKQAITYHLLKEALIHQDFKPGSVLSERELCAHFGVSRPPVHSAVVQLVADGMLVMEHEKRILVPPATPDDLHEIYEMLEYLQVASIRCQRLFSMDSLRNIQTTLDHMADSINDPSLSIFDRYTLDNQFHSLIMRDVENKRLKRSFEKYSNQYANYSFVMFRSGNWREHELHTHQRIYDSLSNGMLSDFTKCLHEHYATAYANYLAWTNT